MKKRQRTALTHPVTVFTVFALVGALLGALGMREYLDRE